VTLPAKHAGDGGALAESALSSAARMREGFNREAPNDARDAPRVN
jgi:hypothetical protein